MAKYNFQDVARSERYFTATLLPHLLMANGFEGADILLRHVFKNTNFKPDDEFEIVTELDPLRDASVVNNFIKDQFKEHGRIAVPDVFIRRGNYILIIEAKFFTLPYWEDLEYQVGEQKRAFDMVRKETNYVNSTIEYCLLLVKAPDGVKNNSIFTLTWDEILNLLETNLTSSDSIDIKYALDIIKQSNSRAKPELSKISNRGHTHISSIGELVDKLPLLLKERKIYVGFSEGFYSDEIDLNYLESRSHYKVSDKQYTSNWIRIEDLVAKYISLKY